MNAPFPESLFFANLPDILKLCTVKITLNPEIVNTGIRDVQIKLCRHLLFLYEDILAMPEPEQLDQIFVIMAIDAPERVTPVKFEACLSYTLAARLSPCWNKAGHLLIQGEHFLASSIRHSAVGMQITVSDSQLCVSIQAYTVRLPPCELSDFNIATGILQDFKNNKNLVIAKNFISNNWCYILPSMKMGQIVSISHNIPSDSPFTSYKDLKNHWNMLYGYKLPDIADEDMIYCSVYFKLIGEKLFTYPFICLRSQPIQYFPHVNLSGVQNAFISDLKKRASHICGFPILLSNKPFYPTPVLTRPSSQDNGTYRVNLTTQLISRAQTYTNIFTSPAACNTDTDQMMESMTQHSKANGLGKLHATQQSPPAEAFIKQATSTPFQLRSPHLSLTHTLNVKRVGPAFKRDVNQVNRRNKKIANPQKRDALEHNNPADNEQHSQNALTPCTLQLPKENKISIVDITEKLKEDVPSMTNSKPFILLFDRKLPSKEKFQKYRNNSSVPDEQAYLSGENVCAKYKRKTKKDYKAPLQNVCRPVCNSETFMAHACDSTQDDFIEVKPKKCKANHSIEEVNIESHARNNQLFKLKNATLENWLIQRGIPTKARAKKEELITKIMQFISFEALHPVLTSGLHTDLAFGFQFDFVAVIIVTTPYTTYCVPELTSCDNGEDTFGQHTTRHDFHKLFLSGEEEILSITCSTLRIMISGKKESLTCRLLFSLCAPHMYVFKSHVEKQSKKLQSLSEVHFCSSMFCILGSKNAISMSMATTWKQKDNIRNGTMQTIISPNPDCPDTLHSVSGKVSLLNNEIQKTR
uniref:Chromosome 18 open reading frame 63 n=1 Tax=Leptobrachium leishanense TaxID=445787 RepID=A0A8C5M9P0_9ANUR